MRFSFWLGILWMTLAVSGGRLNSAPRLSDSKAVTSSTADDPDACKPNGAFSQIQSTDCQLQICQNGRWQNFGTSYDCNCTVGQTRIIQEGTVCQKLICREDRVTKETEWTISGASYTCPAASGSPSPGATPKITPAVE